MVNVAILNAIKHCKEIITECFFYSLNDIYDFSLLIHLEKVIASKKDFDFALDRISMGVGRTNMFITDADKLKTAYHEGGHTITALLTKESTPLHKVTILPRGGALGFV